MKPLTHLAPLALLTRALLASCNLDFAAILLWWHRLNGSCHATLPIAWLLPPFRGSRYSDASFITVNRKNALCRWLFRRRGPFTPHCSRTRWSSMARASASTALHPAAIFVVSMLRFGSRWFPRCSRPPCTSCILASPNPRSTQIPGSTITPWPQSFALAISLSGGPPPPSRRHAQRNAVAHVLSSIAPAPMSTFSSRSSKRSPRSSAFPTVRSRHGSATVNSPSMKRPSASSRHPNTRAPPFPKPCAARSSRRRSLADAPFLRKRTRNVTANSPSASSAASRCARAISTCWRRGSASLSPMRGC